MSSRLGSGAGALVNGLRLTTAVLHPGDQLAFGRDHFIIEAPGLPLRGEVPLAASANDPSTASDDVIDGSPADVRGSIWWLIGAAALIALGLAAILLRGA